MLFGEIGRRNSQVDEISERYAKFQLPPESRHGCEILLPPLYSRPYAVLQRTPDEDCRQAEEPKQLADEASRCFVADQLWLMKRIREEEEV